MTASFSSRSSRWRLARWSAAAALLLLPLVAMQFTNEVNWTGSDFAVFGAMLLVAGLAYEFIASAAGNTAYRLGAGVAVATAFLLVWVNLAVGFIGDEGNPANLVFVGVIALAVIGAVLARFRPAGMARALAATALAQVLVGAVALAGGWGTTYELTMGTTLFTALWLVSAGLFWKASNDAASAAPSA